MSLEAIEQDISSILELAEAPGTAEEKREHLLTLVADIRRLIKEELIELNTHGKIESAG